VKSRTAHELYVKVPHAEGASRCLTDGSEGLGKQVVERLTVGVSLSQFDCFVSQLVVAELLEVVFQMVDGFAVSLEATKESAFADT
jgi:hypothetical protein